jgi:ATP-binding cassette subfamily B protein
MSPRGMPDSGPGAGAHVRHWGATLRRLLALLWVQPGALALIVAASVASVVLHVMGPWQLGRATDLVYSAVSTHRPIDYAQLARLLALVALLYATSAALNWWQAWLSTGLLQGVVRSLRQQAEDKIARLPLSWFDRQPHGEVLSRVTNDLDNISQSLQQLLSQLLMSALSLLGVLVMMGLLSPVLTLMALLAVAASALLGAMLTARAQPYFSAQWRCTGVLNATVEEDCSGHTLIKVFNHQGAARAQFDNDNAALYHSSYVAQALSGAVQPGILFIGNLVFTGVALFGGLRVIGASLSLGLLQAFVQYSRQMTQPLSQMAGMTGSTQSGLASSERVFELLDAPELPADALDRVDAGAAVPPLRGDIAFEDVTFRYQREQPLFEKVNLRASAGQTVAIVGPTGAGKTKLMNLLLRFYEIDAGCIRLDGVDTRSIRRETLRRHFGVVPQETWLFAGTIRENIAYGRSDATEEQVQAAASACHVDDFVRLLPQGYATVIDENGGALSAGQQQLLTIARAFLAQPAVLVLDEATSAVDTRTERLVQQAMAALRVGRTSFVIAHRLSTILDADVIVYMEHGTVLEQGSHAALLQARGPYWTLYQSQFAAAPEAVP